MARTMMVVVGDDREQCEKLKTLGQGMGCTVSVYTPGEWTKALNDQGARTRLMGEMPALSVGSSPVTEGAKILQFPQPTFASHDGGKVRTINELESIAIENAIHEFSGNLTEAAKGFGHRSRDPLPQGEAVQHRPVDGAEEARGLIARGSKNLTPRKAGVVIERCAGLFHFRSTSFVFWPAPP